jgi:sarcosine oxidase subunit delta
MLLIECPWCGPRSEREFRCGGESHIIRPETPDAVDDAAWADYLFFRHNAKGVGYERWLHRFGCGRWFNVARCTTDHRLAAVYAMTDPKPEVEDGR